MDTPYFKWDKDFETGIESIDRQHYKLVEIVNDSIKLNLQNDEVTLEKLQDIQSELGKYVHFHFESEEAVMKSSGIDPRHIEMHQNAHLEFIKQYESYFSDLDTLKGAKQLGEFNEFLIRWLAYHILNMDKNLARQIEYIEKEGLTALQAYEKEEKMLDASSEPLLKALRALFYLVTEKNNELEEKVRLRTLELQEAYNRLERITLVDELTGLKNRRYVMEHIEELIHLWNRYDTVFSILFIDIDKFKFVNDTYGHDYGDLVLREIANFLKENIRKTDIPCRLGGDEFVVICPNCDGACAYQLGQKLNALCKSLNEESKLEFWRASLSIGVAEYSDSVENVSHLLNNADAEMYKAKKMGGGKTFYGGNA